MITDVNVYLGNYPFRRIVNNDAKSLVTLMDKEEIDRACVCSVSGIYYRDVMEGNYELFGAIKGYEDRFIPFCVINPLYAGADADLNKCITELGFRGVRLFPRQHGYRLDDTDCISALKKCAEYDLPVLLTIYIEDLRQRHYLDVSATITVDEVKSAAVKSPNTKFIICNGATASFAAQLSDLDNIYYDFARADTLSQHSFSTLIKNAGVDKIVFGSGAPLQYFGPQRVKLATLAATNGLTDEEINKIKHINIDNILNKHQTSH